MKRKEVLKKEKRKKNVQIEKYRMVTDFEPTFPDIRKAITRFRHIIEDDQELRRSSQKVLSIFKFQKEGEAKT